MIYKQKGLIFCWAFVVLQGCLMFSACAREEQKPVGAATSAVELGYQVIAEYPHNPKAFTQGLILQGETLVETSGLYRQSFIEKYNASTNERVAYQDLPARIFAEGLVDLGPHYWVLTWHQGKVLVLDSETLAVVKVHSYDGQGWGLTKNDEMFFQSDGTSLIKLRDFKDFSLKASINVTEGGKSWRNLNELEFAEGYLWANVWQEPYILAIDPNTGEVKAKADLSELVKLNHTMPQMSVLNGIAYDPMDKTFWITGKYWPKRYKIKWLWPSQNQKTVKSNEKGNREDKGEDSERPLNDENLQSNIP